MTSVRPDPKDLVILKNEEESSQPFLRRTLQLLRRKSLTEFEVFLFGFALVLGNRNANWNQALPYGYYAVLFNFLYVGTSYLCLCLCIGEMTSALPFSGGIFGFVRAALGPFYGYLIACFELVFCLTYIVTKVDNILAILVALGAWDASITPIIIVVLYTIILGLNLIGGKPFWIITSTLGFLTFFLLVLFLLGAFPLIGSNEINFSYHAGPFIPLSWDNIMAARMVTGPQFQGLQYLPLLSRYLKDPCSQLPRVINVSAVLFIIFSVSVSLVACSQYPGSAGLSTIYTPLQYGFSRFLQTREAIGSWLHIPGLFASLFCLFYCSGTQLHSIAKSGLLPTILSKTIPILDTPYTCYLLTAFIGIGFNIYLFYHRIALNEFRNIALLSSFIIFIFCLIAYIHFKYKYNSIQRSFINPLGIWSALYGIINYIFGCIGFIFYSNNHSLWSVYSLIVFTVLSIILYWTYMIKYQTFSDEEKKLLFKAYLINANRNKRQKMLKNNKICPAASKSNADGSSVSQSASKNAKTKVKIESTNLLIQDTSLPILPSDLQDPNSEKEPLESLTKSRSESDSPALRPSHKVEPTLHHINAPASKKLSSKIYNIFSEKMNDILPSSTKSMEDDDDFLAVLAAGGMVDDHVQAIMRARFSIDVESSELMDNCNNND